jgi:general secretion pathway protein H
MPVTSATGSAGFTLLELLVVLAIMVLIAAAWPLASSRVFAAQHMRNESQQLAGAIRVAQMTARITGQPQELRVYEEGRAYRIAADTHELPVGLTLSIRGQSAETSAERFLLFPDGSSSGETLAISFQERTSTVRILPATGRVELNP